MESTQVPTILSDGNIHNKQMPEHKKNMYTNYPDPTFISTATGRQNPGPGTYYLAHTNPLKPDNINNYTFLSAIERFRVPDKEAPPVGNFFLSKILRNI